MIGGRYDGYELQNSAVRIGLKRQSLQRVTRTLDLEAVERPVNHRDV
jgi:hypothetical protein